MTRDPFPGWVSMLDPDPLAVPEPDPPPRVRPGCIQVAGLVVLAVALWVWR